jgi:hypothetical protein
VLKSEEAKNVDKGEQGWCEEKKDKMITAALEV